MRTIYLQGSLSLNGRDSLQGRRLVDALRSGTDEVLLGHSIVPEASARTLHPAVREDTLSEVTMLQFDPDIVFLENGLFLGNSGGWRIEQKLAEEFVERGGTLIAADININSLREMRQLYSGVGEFFGASAGYCDNEPIVGYDRRSCWKGEKQILCRAQDMVLSDWLRPIYEGIPEILVGGAIRLNSFPSILASGNRNSTWSDASDGIPGPDNLPFASVHKRGAGFTVMICGSVSSDAWLEGCPHNTQWLVNIAKFLSDTARLEQRRTRSAVKSTECLFLSHSWQDKPVVSEVHECLRREHALRTWLDQTEMVVGDSLPHHIEENIRGSSYMVLFWSQHTAQSEWVRREIEFAKAHSVTLLLVRLDDSAVMDEMANLLRLECDGDSPAEIAHELSNAVTRRNKRARIDAARALHKESESLVAAAQPAFEPLRTGSLTRKEGAAIPDAIAPFNVLDGLQTPVQIATLSSDYRIDILSFVDNGLLISGSGRFKNTDIERVRELVPIEGLQHVSFQTGMDGHLDDHRPTRRHIIYGYEDVGVFDRTVDKCTMRFPCDEGASVQSAAWSPGGDSIAVGSTNYLTIAADDGEIIAQHNLYEPRSNYSPKSVVWQPCEHPIYASGTSVFIANSRGEPQHTLTDLQADVIAVAVSPCCRFIAAAAKDGQVAIWSELGQLLTQFRGFGSDYWSASRCLAFSPDGRFLVQAACHSGDGFLVLDLTAKSVARVQLPRCSLLAFHPTEPGLLATVANDTIFFWRLTAS